MKWPTEADIRRFFLVLNTRNIDRVMEQYADKATLQWPETEAPVRGKTAIRAFLTATFAAYPDWSLDVTRVYLSGDESAVVNSVHATHTGSLTRQDGRVVVATGLSSDQEQLTRLIFDGDGRVTLMRGYGDPRPCGPSSEAPAGSPGSPTGPSADPWRGTWVRDPAPVMAVPRPLGRGPRETASAPVAR